MQHEIPPAVKYCQAGIEGMQLKMQVT